MWRPTASLDALRERARLRDLVRRHFNRHPALEVDPPLLQAGANLDRGVHPLHVDTAHGERYLITSPEHPLKRLLAAGAGDVWSLSAAFRDGERGRHHQIEFRMLEWYRRDRSLIEIREETLTLLAELTGLGAKCDHYDHRDALRHFAGVDPTKAEAAELRAALPEHARDTTVSSRDELLDLVLATVVQPRLPTDRWTTIQAWPATQAAQARLDRSDPARPTAERCEIYRGALEIANGYHECTDPDELATRLETERRTDSRAEDIVRDTAFEAALRSGLPPCSGMAVGFDRVVMLALGTDDIADAVPFAW